MTHPEINPGDFHPMIAALEQAVSEIRDEAPDAAVVEAAAARVWARLASESAAQSAPASLHHVRGCADFRALIPEYRAGRLPAARVTLLQDHLHECVACRKVYEGKVVPMPVPFAARRVQHPVRWAAAAALVAAAGLSVWIAFCFSPRPRDPQQGSCIAAIEKPPRNKHNRSTITEPRSHDCSTITEPRRGNRSRQPRAQAHKR